MKDEIADLRRDYNNNTLQIEEVEALPIPQFSKWFDDAMKGGVLEPNAMILSTVNEQGRPSSRVVLLKGVDEKGFIFYTNYQSRKAQELAGNPMASLLFNWMQQERQIRIEGKVELLEENLSNSYYNKRPLGSRIGAWSSPQSRYIPNRKILEENVKSIEHLFEGNEEISRPPFWGGFRLVPDKMEFWQGRSNRLHDRLMYSLESDGSWRIERIAP